ncbi:hypothetical protein Barb6_02368 [Bacteroidales bacterium Barb6]|nr:hypothetical protein Barb6_02368 [Bacteroidales bacterium Barb6]
MAVRVNTPCLTTNSPLSVIFCTGIYTTIAQKVVNFPSVVVAVMFASPMPAAVTNPFSSTEAICLSELDHISS